MLTAVVLRAIKMFSLDTSRVHHDTTGVTVYGDYNLYTDPDEEEPLCRGHKASFIRAIVGHRPHMLRATIGHALLNLEFQGKESLA